MNKQDERIKELCNIVFKNRRLMANDELEIASKELYSLTKAEPNSYEHAVALVGLNASYTRIGNFKKVKKYMFEAFTIINENNYEDLMSTFYGNMALYYTYCNDNYSAIDCYLKNIDICRKQKNYFNLITNLNNLGDLLLIGKDYNGALKYFKECLKVKNLDSIDVSGQVVVYINISKCKIKLGDLEGAIEALNKAKELYANCTYYILILSIISLQLEIDYIMKDESKFQADLIELERELDKNEDQLIACDTVIDVLKMVLELSPKPICDKMMRILDEFIETNPDNMYLIPYMRYKIQYTERFDREHLMEAYRDFYEAALIVEENTRRRNVDILNNKVKLHEATKKETKLIKENKKLNKSSSLDEMTNVLNKAAIYKVLNNNLKMCLKNKTTFGLIFLDVDHFKEYNDTYGHLKGDEVLKIIADEIQNCGNDFIVGRFGGDEFIITCVGLKDEKIETSLRQLTKRVEAMKLPHVKNETSDYVTISGGYVNLIPNENDKRSDFINMADKALYEAKTNRNCFKKFEKRV